MISNLSQIHTGCRLPAIPGRCGGVGGGGGGAGGGERFGPYTKERGRARYGCCQLLA